MIGKHRVLLQALAVLAIALTMATMTPTQAHAADRGQLAARTTFYTCVGGVFGAMVGAGVGGGLAHLACRRHPECMAHYLYIPFFGGIGAISGLAVGATKGAKGADRRPGRAVWTAALVGVGGLALGTGGLWGFNAPIAVTGAVILFGGAALAAGLAASRSPHLRVAPAVSMGQNQLLVGIQGRF